MDGTVRCYDFGALSAWLVDQDGESINSGGGGRRSACSFDLAAIRGSRPVIACWIAREEYAVSDMSRGTSAAEYRYERASSQRGTSERENVSDDMQSALQAPTESASCWMMVAFTCTSNQHRTH